MDEKLEKKVRRLLLNATLEHSYDYATPSTAGNIWYSSDEPRTNPDERGDWELHHKQAKLVVKLYQQLNAKEQEGLLKTLEGQLQNPPQESTNAAALSLIHTGHAGRLFECIRKSLLSYQEVGYRHAIASITKALVYRPTIFSEDEVEDIYNWCETYLSGENVVGKNRRDYPSLHTELNKVVGDLAMICNVTLTGRFAKQIESAFNPELNKDQERVIEAIEGFGFPLDLAESLRHIQNTLQQANEPMLYRGVMSAIRVFTERLFETVAKNLDPNTKVDGKKAEIAAQFFKDRGLVSGDMKELIVSLRHYLSNDGTHRLKSRIEDARIAKNMTIEVSLYLLTRLKEVGRPGNSTG